MIGSIIGDIVGAPYEGDKLVQDKRDFRPFFLNGLAQFTDDTNLTIAIADALLNNDTFEGSFLKWYKKFPDLGYGSSFREWAGKGGGYQNDSRGNGAVMRISPITLFANALLIQDPQGNLINESWDNKMEWALQTSVETTLPTHNCAEARNGVMAVTVAMMLASQKATKVEIKKAVEDLAKYDLSADVETVRETWAKKDIRCDITVPQALICFLESKNYEDCIRLSIYSKGDVDTIAAIAGGIAEWFYGVDSINPGILAEAKLRLAPEMIDIINKCYENTLKW